MSDEPKDSVSQQVTGLVDLGKESFSVDSTPEPVEGKTASDAAADDKSKEDKATKEGADKEPEATPDSDEDSDKDKDKDEGGEKKGKDEAIETEPVEEKVPKGVEKRLAKMRRKQGDAEREATALRQELEATKAELEAQKQADIGEKPQRPNADDFEEEGQFDDALAEYYEKLSEWNTRKVIAEQEIKKRQTDKEAAEKEREKILKERHAEIRRGLNEAKSKYDDFDEVIKDVQVPDSMLEIFEKLPNVGDVAYHLGKNLDVLDELSGLSLVDATMRLMEISNSLKPKKTTKAPPPIKPESTTGGGIKTLENMSYAEYKKHRQKQREEAAGR